MQEIYTKLQALLGAHQTGVCGIVVAGDPQICPTGTKFVLNEVGELIEGNIDPELLRPIQNECVEILQNKTPQTINLSVNRDPLSEDADRAVSPLTLTLFIDPIYPQTQLIILGGGHIALPLVKMGYPLGFKMTVVDDRPSFANTVRFPEAEQVICGDFAKVIQELPLDSNSFVVIVTRGHRYDELCLAEILNHPVKPTYVGMIGSRRKVAAIIHNLKESGFSEEILDTVHSPIGLDIGAQTPEEIALSILAEMVRVKHYGQSKGMASPMKDMRGKRSNG